MDKATLRERFDKICWNPISCEVDKPTEYLLDDLFNYFSAQDIENFYEYVLEERELTDRKVQMM